MAEEPSFEHALERLEAIVDRLEGGELPREQALALFEEGVGLSRTLAARLGDAEQRVQVLVEEGGELRARALDASEES